VGAEAVVSSVIDERAEKHLPIGTLTGVIELRPASHLAAHSLPMLMLRIAQKV
jgi:hypothetical protein